MTNATKIEFEIERLEQVKKDIEYDFVNCKDFASRRELFAKYLTVDAEINNLINFSDAPCFFNL